MASGDNLRFGVDLVTFFHPGFWGVDGYDAIIDYAKADPRAFWDKILDSVQASGVTGVELTFSPFNWQDAIKTYGSVEGFGASSPGAGLQLASGFFAELEASGDFTEASAQAPSSTRRALRRLHQGLRRRHHGDRRTDAPDARRGTGTLPRFRSGQDHR
jgi:hypothetical protein